MTLTKTPKLCIAGANGRMGRAIIAEAIAANCTVVGALEAAQSPAIGKTLQDVGSAALDVVIQGPDALEDAVRDADVYISFTTPEADVRNTPVVAGMGKRIVIGTTGLSADERHGIDAAIAANTVPAVIAPNFSIGVNVLFKMAEMLKAFPDTYDTSLVEAHHTGKKDAPSGTSKRLTEIIMDVRGYEKEVNGRSGFGKREANEFESLAIRAGGIPGIHEITVAGEYEMLQLKHTAFSRNVFAQGAVVAARWLMTAPEMKVYSMQDVLFS